MGRKKLILSCLLVGVALLAVVATVLFAVNKSTTTPPADTPKQVSLTGNLTCLKHKGVKPGQPVTLECAIGLVTSDQRYYGLQDLPDNAATTSFETKIQVTGTLSQPPSDYHYDVAGMITVDTITTDAN